MPQLKDPILIRQRQDAIIAAYLAGEKVDAIAATYNVARTYPAILARRHGFDGRPNGRPDSLAKSTAKRLHKIACENDGWCVVSTDDLRSILATLERRLSWDLT